MKLKKLGPGSVLTGDIRSELADQQLPTGPQFVVRANQEGPFALTTLALELNLLINQTVNAGHGWIVVPINRPLSVGQRLGWSVFAGFRIPALVAVLIVKQQVRFLSRKEDLAAGGLWSTSVVLQPQHLS